MKHYFLGLAANYTRGERLRHTFAVGRKRDCDELQRFLAQKYNGDAILCKNGRSALALALNAYFEPGDKILVNGFTCYAVHEAIKAAKLVPVYVDISKDDLNFDMAKLKEPDVFHSGPRPAGPSPRAAGATSRAAALRTPSILAKTLPHRLPRPSDHLRARFYPLFGAMCRGLSYIHLGGILMRLLVKIHWVEKSADNKLDLTRKISKFEAKLALRQLKALKKGVRYCIVISEG